MRELSIVTGLTPSSGSETNLVAVHHSFAPWPPGWLAVSIGLSYKVGGKKNPEPPGVHHLKKHFKIARKRKKRDIVKNNLIITFGNPFIDCRLVRITLG